MCKNVLLCAIILLQFPSKIVKWVCSIQDGVFLQNSSDDKGNCSLMTRHNAKFHVTFVVFDKRCGRHLLVGGGNIAQVKQEPVPC